MAVPLALPAAGHAADDGSTSSNSGGGVTYYESASATTGAITLSVKRGAWLGRAIRIRGKAEELAGQTVAIERRGSRGAWAPLQSVRLSKKGTFRTKWTPESPGRHRLRAVVTSASTADREDARTASAVERVTVYRKVMATWYGPGFYGNRTACGQRLTRRTLGVAHKTLPCGSKVAIRYEGRSIVVPVIDRGPYAEGMEYDLTSATATRLGVTYTSPIGAAVLSR